MPRKQQSRQSNKTGKCSRADDRERKRIARDSDYGVPSYEGTCFEVECSRIRRANETNSERDQRLTQLSELHRPRDGQRSGHGLLVLYNPST